MANAVVNPSIAWSAAVAGLFLASCLVDPDNPCGDQLVEADNGSCVCPDGQVVEEGHCVDCGTHELVEAGKCVCEVGYARGSASADCEPAPEPEDCEDGSDCAEASCESSEVCPEGMLCDVYDTGQCVAEPDGLGMSCESDDDCAGTEATYCEVFSTLTCVIQGCAENSGICPGDMACCDFAILGRSLCVGIADLTDGDCPAPGELIERE